MGEREREKRESGLALTIAINGWSNVRQWIGMVSRHGRSEGFALQGPL